MLNKAVSIPKLILISSRSYVKFIMHTIERDVGSMSCVGTYIYKTSVCINLLQELTKWVHFWEDFLRMIYAQLMYGNRKYL